MGQRDHYAVLGLPPTATAAEIRAAFRRLARAHHPDVRPGDADAERRFKRIARAYATLSDPERRRRYDARAAGPRFGAAGPPSAPNVDGAPIYHPDLGRHSDFYQANDPLTVAEAAALVDRHPGWLRRAIREGRLPAARGRRGYLLRRRDVERLDRATRRRRRERGDRPPTRTGEEPTTGPARERGR